MTLPTVEECQAAYELAKTAENEVESRQREAEGAARDEVRRQFAAERLAAAAVRSARYGELRAAQDRTAAHPWTGKRVFKIHQEYEGWSHRVVKETRIEGIVETMRHSTEMPANARYSRPRVGEGFVRLLKKDGTLGLKYDALRGWQLVEGEAEAAQTEKTPTTIP